MFEYICTQPWYQPLIELSWRRKSVWITLLRLCCVWILEWLDQWGGSGHRDVWGVWWEDEHQPLKSKSETVSPELKASSGRSSDSFSCCYIHWTAALFSKHLSSLQENTASSSESVACESLFFLYLSRVCSDHCSIIRWKAKIICINNWFARYSVFTVSEYMYHFTVS